MTAPIAIRLGLLVIAPTTAAGSHADWQVEMITSPPSMSGCFTVVYPSTTWTRVDCGTPSAIPSTVGNENDHVAKVPSGSLIDLSDGGITTSSTVGGEYDSGRGCNLITGVTGSRCSNTFSIQDNSNFFTTSYSGSSMDAWQQFLFDNNGVNGTADIYMQYWLIGWLNSHTSCPSKNSNLNTPWYASGTSCFANSKDVSFAAITASGLPGIALAGEAKCGSCGSNDEVAACTSASCYSVAVSDSVLSLASHWVQAEWNVFGIYDGDRAYFGSGTVLRVGDNIAHFVTVSCLKAGFTGETNNHDLISCGAGPSAMFFGES